MHRGLMGATVGWGGGQKRGGGGGVEPIVGVGGQQWGCVQLLRTALHTISISLQNSLKALRALYARWVLPVYPVFEDEKSKASHEKSVKRKIA